jgi:hypothetical protein
MPSKDLRFLPHHISFRHRDDEQGPIERVEKGESLIVGKGFAPSHLESSSDQAHARGSLQRLARLELFMTIVGIRAGAALLVITHRISEGPTGMGGGALIGVS